MRYDLIDYDELKDLLNFNEMDELAESYRGWIEEALKKVSIASSGWEVDRERRGGKSIFCDGDKGTAQLQGKRPRASEKDGVFELERFRCFL